MVFNNGSNASFCTKTLCNKLGIVCNERNRTKLTVSTINRTREFMNSHIIKNLLITSTNEEEDVELPPHFALDEIPTSKENTIQQEHLLKWPHLDSIQILKIKL